MSKKILIAVVIIAVIGGVGLVAISGSKTSQPSSTSSSQTATTPTVLPVDSNPIVNNSVVPGLEVTAIAVENNVDPTTNKGIGDRLQMSIKNITSGPLDNLEAYYVMKDTTTGQTEGYYQKLDGLTLAAGETKTVFFDNQTGVNHYPENKYSLYRTSPNEVVFDVEVSSPKVKIVTATVTKDAGTGEQPD